MKRSGPALAFLDEQLDALRRDSLLRQRRAPVPRVALSFCSNDYLDLAARPAPPLPAGAGASRLVVGEHDVHAELELASARLVGQPSALAFTSGYAANVGLLTALARQGDLIVSDELNHASIIDGARLSRARVIVAPHLDTDAVERALASRAETRAFVVTESYFSMDGDSPDLARLRRVCDTAEAALLVDEAHALGVLGPEGRGLCWAAGISPDALIGTYGKAFGAAGAFVAGSESLTAWLWNRARSFVFSTGLSPATAAAALDGIRRATAEPQRRERVLAASRRLREGLRDLGITTRGAGPIVPWIVGDPEATVRLATAIRCAGVDVTPIRPPTVPAGTSRLRFTVTAAHDDAAIDAALRAVRQALETHP